MADDSTIEAQSGKILTRDDVAEKLHLTADTAGQLIARTGKGIYLCRRTYIFERDLDSFLSSLRGGSSEKK